MTWALSSHAMDFVKVTLEVWRLRSGLPGVASRKRNSNCHCERLLLKADISRCVLIAIGLKGEARGGKGAKGGKQQRVIRHHRRLRAGSGEGEERQGGKAGGRPSFCCFLVASSACVSTSLGSGQVLRPRPIPVRPFLAPAISTPLPRRIRPAVLFVIRRPLSSFPFLHHFLSTSSPLGSSMTCPLSPRPPPSSPHPPSP